MKQIIAIVSIMFLILWYADTGSCVVLDKNEDTLSVVEIRDLAKRGILSTPIDYDKRYFTTNEVRYIRTKGYIPFTYKRDTLTAKGLQYWSRSY